MLPILPIFNVTNTVIRGIAIHRREHILEQEAEREVADIKDPFLRERKKKDLLRNHQDYLLGLYTTRQNAIDDHRQEQVDNWNKAHHPTLFRIDQIFWPLIAIIFIVCVVGFIISGTYDFIHFLNTPSSE